MTRDHQDNAFGPHPFAAPWDQFDSQDGSTDSGVSHRALSSEEQPAGEVVTTLQQMLVRHHHSPDAIRRDEERRQALERLGHGHLATGVSRYPSSPTTKKGNLAEIMLAEYLVATTNVTLPVYRLRYNPNVDQSMKGDDVLAFDLDSDPVRIIVGEAKYRGTSTKAAVEDMVTGLLRSHQSGLPASLTFVAERLYETEQRELADRVMNCVMLFAEERLRIDYVGLLMSDSKSASRVNQHTSADLRRLAVISLGLSQPDALVDACYQGLGN